MSNHIKPVNVKAKMAMQKDEQIVHGMADIPAAADCSTVFAPGWETACWGGIVKDLKTPGPTSYALLCVLSADLPGCHCIDRNLWGGGKACWWPNQVPDASDTTWKTTCLGGFGGALKDLVVR